MATVAVAHSKKHTELHQPDVKTPCHFPLRAEDAKRSVNNILDWNSYLPADCVKAMVRMGWDYTT